MNLTNLTRITLATLITASITTTQTNAMMARYVASLIGDTCLAAAGLSYMNIQQKMRPELEAKLIQLEATHSQISQLNKDIQKIAPYVPILIPGGAVLSLGSRISMIRKAGGKGFALALLSIPINCLLIDTGYEARLKQAPDASLIAKTKDTNLYNKWFGKRNS